MFRFSIRELMLVTLVVGLAIGWCIDRKRGGTVISELSWKAKTLEAAVSFLGFKPSFNDNGLNLEATGSSQGYTYSLQISKDGRLNLSPP